MLAAGALLERLGEWGEQRVARARKAAALEAQAADVARRQSIQ